MFKEAKRQVTFQLMFNLVTNSLFVAVVFLVMKPFVEKKNFLEEFMTFMAIGIVILVAQLLVLFVLHIKGNKNAHLVDDGIVCKTELMEITKGAYATSGQYTFYVTCKYKSPKGEYLTVKSTTRYVKTVGVPRGDKPPEGFICVPKVYVDRDDNNKYYVSVMVKN